MLSGISEKFLSTISRKDVSSNWISFAVSDSWVVVKQHGVLPLTHGHILLKVTDVALLEGPPEKREAV